MTIATSPKPSPRSRSHSGRSGRHPRAPRRAARSVLGRYIDHAGRPREVVARAGYAGSVLVLDRDARTLEDRRLVAHLAPDEPVGNAELVCHHYLSDPRGRWCRPVATEDLRAPSPSMDPSMALLATTEYKRRANRGSDELARAASALLDRQGRKHELGFVRDRLSIPELRWLCAAPNEPSPTWRSVSVREVVASLESYEPVRAHTLAALRRHREDPDVSVAVLRAELERMGASRIVLNRALRHAVLRAVRTQGMSMSEIALRCGRIKYDARGNASGETSWLARRIGISPEGGEREPTPWVHSDVLALIARAGLGISPREVELG